MPAIKKPNEHFDSLIYTGDGSATTRAVTGLNFQPDFVWIKDRTAADDHCLQDVIRGFGTGKAIRSNTTDAETDAGATYYGYISSVNSTGFVVGKGTDAVNGNRWVNFNTYLYVAWNWKAGGAAVTNNDGTITSQVSANPTAGFSVVTFTAPSSGNFSAGHGLGVTPGMVITKVRGRATSWITWHNRLNSGSPGTTYYVDLNTTGGQSTFASVWGSTGVTSSVIGMGIGASCAASDTIVAYCFAAVAGYSAFGSFVGNGTQGAGPFVYTGFRPRYVLIKNINGAYDWHCFDTARGQYNYSGSNILKPNSTAVELTARNDVQIDFLSNGFRLIGNDIGINQSTSTHIYAAFASAPFKYANAF